MPTPKDSSDNTHARWGGTMVALSMLGFLALVTLNWILIPRTAFGSGAEGLAQNIMEYTNAYQVLWWVSALSYGTLAVGSVLLWNRRVAGVKAPVSAFWALVTVACVLALARDALRMGAFSEAATAYADAPTTFAALHGITTGLSSLALVALVVGGVFIFGGEARSNNPAIASWIAGTGVAIVVARLVIMVSGSSPGSEVAYDVWHWLGLAATYAHIVVTALLVMRIARPATATARTTRRATAA